MRPPYDAWIEAARNARSENGTIVIAADTPSGLSAQTGHAASPCVQADATVTMIAIKPGFLSEQSAPFVGRLALATLGIDVEGDFPEFICASNDR